MHQDSQYGDRHQAGGDPSDGLLEDLPPNLRESLRPRRAAPEPTEPRGVPQHIGARPPSYPPAPSGAPSVNGGDWYGATLPDIELDGGSYGPLTVRGASVRGDAHRHLHECRQDALGVIRIGPTSSPATATATDTTEDGLLLLAVADGVGSAPLSHRGSHGMVAMAAQCLDRVAGQLAAALRAEDAGALRTLVEDAVDLAAARLRRTRPSERPEQYATTLRALLVPLDPEVRVRGFFAVGDGGLFRLRPDGWHSIRGGGPEDSHALHSAHGPHPSYDRSTPHSQDIIDTRTAALPAAYDRVTTSLLAPSEPGDVLVLCTDGLEGPLTGNPELRRLLAAHWGSGAAVPQPADFLWQAQTRVKSYDDDRTVICLWEGVAAP
ncbi:protein phosphatase 2C domain-containing protein [Streptomyces sp. N2-109]|uniref:Protein phosphatase 2C domain-containing protein n=1 Tax=Streptomyces gossypii TaxID=2883101 RepID=A0ABT2JNG5_9ACTN|nr:protein phosphatase 2C domain-containing protein [Streptomyces gossypii]MCT2589412.1 protein phosphatase 2C domain-containing protein [Streptomyces gossypii]